MLATFFGPKRPEKLPRRTKMTSLNAIRAQLEREARPPELRSGPELPGPPPDLDAGTNLVRFWKLFGRMLEVFAARWVLKLQALVQRPLLSSLHLQLGFQRGIYETQHVKDYL